MESTIKDYQKIIEIAYGEIPIEKNHPTYKMFELRKVAAQRFKEHSGENSEVYLEYIEYYNENIRKYFKI